MKCLAHKWSTNGSQCYFKYSHAEGKDSVWVWWWWWGNKRMILMLYKRMCGKIIKYILMSIKSK